MSPVSPMINAKAATPPGVSSEIHTGSTRFVPPGDDAGWIPRGWRSLISTTTPGGHLEGYRRPALTSEQKGSPG
jgi:hypothetical protein